MIIKDIPALISDPSLLNESTINDLDALVKLYPYFQTGRMLYLKNLQKINDDRFSRELPKTALFITDRSKLYEYIEGLPLKPKKKAPVKSNVTEIKSRTLALIDAFLSDEEVTDNQDPIIDNTDYLAETDEVPLPQKMLASYDYLTFLLNSHHKTDSDQEEEAKTEQEPETRFQHQELIDNFISENQEGLKVKVQVPTDDDIRKDPVIQKEKDEKDDFFSETLAKIYIKQKRYEKALDIIRKLYLKFPEKNTYFADQIRFLEILIANSK